MNDYRKLSINNIEAVDDITADILKKKTPAQRIKIGFNLWTSASKMLFAHLKTTHHDWADKDIEKEIAKRLSYGIV